MKALASDLILSRFTPSYLDYNDVILESESSIVGYENDTLRVTIYNEHRIMSDGHIRIEFPLLNSHNSNGNEYTDMISV